MLTSSSSSLLLSPLSVSPSCPTTQTTQNAQNASNNTSAPLIIIPEDLSETHSALRLSQDRAHITGLERTICTNFICCNVQHPDFHAFLEHHEKTHVGPSAPIPTVSTVSPGNAPSSSSSSKPSLNPLTIPNHHSSAHHRSNSTSHASALQHASSKHSNVISPVYTPFTPSLPLGYTWDTGFRFPFASVYENASSRSSVASSPLSSSPSSTSNPTSSPASSSSGPSTPTTPQDLPLLPMVYKEPYDLFHPFDERGVGRYSVWGDEGLGMGGEMDLGIERGWDVYREGGYGVISEGSSDIEIDIDEKGDVDMRSLSDSDSDSEDEDDNAMKRTKGAVMSPESSMSPPPELTFSSSCCSSDAEMEVEGEEGDAGRRAGRGGAAFEMSGMGRAERRVKQRIQKMGMKGATGRRSASAKMKETGKGKGKMRGSGAALKPSEKSMGGIAKEGVEVKRNANGNLKGMRTASRSSPRVAVGSSSSTSASGSSSPSPSGSTTTTTLKALTTTVEDEEEDEDELLLKPQDQNQITPTPTPTSSTSSTPRDNVAVAIASRSCSIASSSGAGTRSSSVGGLRSSSSSMSLELAKGGLSSSTSSSGVVRPPVKSRSAALGGRKREKTFKCPTPRCTKAYLNPNGLKYHLEKGTCKLEGPEDEAEGVEGVHVKGEEEPEPSSSISQPEAEAGDGDARMSSPPNSSALPSPSSASIHIHTPTSTHIVASSTPTPIPMLSVIASAPRSLSGLASLPVNHASEPLAIGLGNTAATARSGHGQVVEVV